MSRRNRKRNVRPQQVQPQQAPQGSAVIAAAEQQVETQLVPNTRESYLKIVVAGMKAGLANGPNSILASLQKSKDPISDCAKGAVALVLVLRHQSQGIMPVKAMIPAAMTLMLKALSFCDRTGIVAVGPQQLVQATHVFANTLLAKFNVTPQMMQTAMGKVHSLTQDPVAMEQMKRASGVVQHPGASVPTPMPGGNA